MHDPRIGRFFALDPLAPKYPHNSPYAFSENCVIDHVELEGLEKAKADGSPDYDATFGIKPLPAKSSPVDVFIQQTQRKNAGLNSTGTGYAEKPKPLTKEDHELSSMSVATSESTYQPKYQSMPASQVIRSQGEELKSRLEAELGEVYSVPAAIIGFVFKEAVIPTLKTADNVIMGDMTESLHAAPDLALTIFGGKALQYGGSKILQYGGAKALSKFGTAEVNLMKSPSTVGRVFWSGGEGPMNLATNFAMKEGKTTLGMTRAGQNLQNLITTKNIPWSEARPMWVRLSTAYAKGAKGSADYFGTQMPGSIWIDHELPILLERGITIRLH